MPTRAQRPRLPETSEGQRQARKAWNGGLVGQPRPPAVTAAVTPCPVDGCGSLATDPRPARAMVRVEVPGTGEPARWYCPGRCAAIGRALADIRSITTTQGDS
ncbi:hypothetical protein CF54_04180 [Streptomyces sp. Tu 6176]|uniref:hypothetical protein n=1 Tax=Streptomyces sp. Tu 6176 TaxID=1470557 RepID=UPI00044C206E|nr:hypothetical protein [Streptomyces sp. Tu 6176]EYT83962.1 hypothetical protein CF54_04180 [Streptomyces sp. Tu 6176]